MKPDFLIIGAMKCGTTTLFRDLAKHPSIFVPGNKEPEVLLGDAPASEHEAEYAEHFSGARHGQIKGEASTAYTKRPMSDNVAERAFALCGPGLKVIYLRREPVSRITSHYRHALEHGTITVPFTDALRQHPELIDITRYDWQLAPWREAFAADNVLVLDLEDYSKNREARIVEVLRFLGLDPSKMPAIDAGERANTAGEAKTIANPVLRRLIYSGFYQNRLKTMFPDTLRAKIRQTILPAPPITEVEVSAADRAFIQQRLNSHSSVPQGVAT